MKNPFEAVSVAGTGMYGVAVYILVAIAQHFNVPLTEEAATIFVQNVVGVVGFALWAWGQYSRKDLKAGIVRKSRKASA